MNAKSQVLIDLNLALETNQPVTIHTTYKGLPVLSPARIKSVENEIVTLVCNEPGLVCLKSLDKVAIIGSAYFEPCAAKVNEIRRELHEVVMQDFSYLANKYCERRIIRVEPSRPTPILLTMDVVEVSGELADLSLSGAGVRIRLRDDDPRLKPGKLAQLSFELPDGSLHVSGRILGRSRVSGYHRLSIRFIPTPDQKRLVFNYLIKRRAEIEAELRKEYEAWMSEPAGSGGVSVG